MSPGWRAVPPGSPPPPGPLTTPATCTPSPASAGTSDWTDPDTVHVSAHLAVNGEHRVAPPPLPPPLAEKITTDSWHTFSLKIQNVHQNWFNVGPAAQKMAQHLTSIGSTSIWILVKIGLYFHKRNSWLLFKFMTNSTTTLYITKILIERKF